MMSIIALESNITGGPDLIYRSPPFIHGMSSYNGIYDPSGGAGGDQRRFSGSKAPAPMEEDNGGDSCSSSSIGRNSDDDDDDGSGVGDGEVQSSVREGGGGGGGALSNLNALEEVLPIKRGISTFYPGKSKSYTSLADAETCSSVREIAKPEDAYTRKRKNLLAHSIISDKNDNPLSRSSSSGGMSKRLASSSSSTLGLGFTMASSVSSNNNEGSVSKSSSPSTALPPLPPHARRLPNNEPSSMPPRQSPGRSLSLSDLQDVKAPTPPATDTVMNNKDK